MDTHEPQPSSLSENIKLWLFVGLLCLPIIYTVVSVAQTIESGVIYIGRRNPTPVTLRWYNPFVVLDIAAELFFGCILPVGVLVGLWATRNDKY
jgi:hypothetical protein